jgi:outer membrane lipoprotein-sorting protein
LLSGTAALLLFAAAPGTRADEKSDALMKEVEAASKAATTLTADLDMSMTIQGKAGKPNENKFHGTVKLKKPNMARIDMLGGPGGDMTVASDGKTVYTLNGDQYQKTTADAQGGNINAQFALQVPIFFGSGLSMLGKDLTYQYVGQKSVDGADYQLVNVVTKSNPGLTVTLYISSDKLVTRVNIGVKQGDQALSLDSTLKNVKLNTDLADADFAYKLPANAKEMQMPDYDAKLVKVGKPAPTFDLLKPNGGKVTLASALKGKKAVLVNFWFYG